MHETIQRLGELIRLQRVYQWNGDTAQSHFLELEIAGLRKEIEKKWRSLTETEHEHYDKAISP